MSRTLYYWSDVFQSTGNLLPDPHDNKQLPYQPPDARSVYRRLLFPVSHRANPIKPPGGWKHKLFRKQYMPDYRPG